MATHPIEYHNRYTGKIETEAVYGEKFLKWAYSTYVGHFGTWLMFKRAWFSRLYGWLMNKKSSKSKIAPFIKRYGVKMDDFRGSCSEYTNFNDFFTRELKPGVRPVNNDPKTAIFPADGRHLGFQDVSKTKRIFIKGQSFNLPQLLGCQRLANRYKNGSLVISRLCPVDYHRFHFPLDGALVEQQYLKGSLYSVNPLALRRNIRILSSNRRMLSTLETEHFGQVLMLEVGATCVGSIVQNTPSGQSVQKGQEKGYFKFGGSTTILLFEPGTIQLAPDLLEHSAQSRELYAHIGDSLGTAL